jgi:hypothetical protein
VDGEALGVGLLVAGALDAGLAEEEGDAVGREAFAQAFFQEVDEGTGFAAGDLGIVGLLQAGGAHDGGLGPLLRGSRALGEEAVQLLERFQVRFQAGDLDPPLRAADLVAGEGTAGDQEAQDDEAGGADPGLAAPAAPGLAEGHEELHGTGPHGPLSPARAASRGSPGPR